MVPSHSPTRRSVRRGFTLIELIATIVVLALLAALAIPSFTAVIRRARIEARVVEVVALAREAAALSAFDGLSGWTQEHWETASDDVRTSAAGVVEDTVGYDVLTDAEQLADWTDVHLEICDPQTAGVASLVDGVDDVVVLVVVTQAGLGSLSDWTTRGATEETGAGALTHHGWDVGTCPGPGGSSGGGGGGGGPVDDGGDGDPGTLRDDWGISGLATGAGCRSFSSAGVTTGAHDVAEAPDGSLWVVGVCDPSSGSIRWLWHFDDTGAFDTSLGSSGHIALPFDLYPHAVVVQPDGKPVVVGAGMSTSFTVARFNTDGTLDTTFGGSGTGYASYGYWDANGFGRDVLLQPDGKIVVAGRLPSEHPTYGNGVEPSGVLRLNSDGTLDTTFGDGGYRPLPTNVGWTIGDASRIVAVPAGGFLTVFQSGADTRLAKLDANGDLDPSFGASGMLDLVSLGYDGALDPTGLGLQAGTRAVVAGSTPFQTSQLMAVDIATSSLDTSFGSSGFATIPAVANEAAFDDLAVGPSGRVYVFGQVRGGDSLYDQAVWRFDDAGVADASFDADGLATSDGFTLNGVHDFGNRGGLAANGEPLIAAGGTTNLTGSFYPIPFGVARFND